MKIKFFLLCIGSLDHLRNIPQVTTMHHFSWDAEASFPLLIVWFNLLCTHLLGKDYWNNCQSLLTKQCNLGINSHTIIPALWRVMENYFQNQIFFLFILFTLYNICTLLFVFLFHFSTADIFFKLIFKEIISYFFNCLFCYYFILFID